MTASARAIKRNADPEGDAREALVRYLTNIFPNETRANLAKVAEHQVEYLRYEGFKLVPVKITDLMEN